MTGEEVKIRLEENNKKIEEVLFYHNTITRRTKIPGLHNYCSKPYYDNMAEILILTNYVKKFEKNITELNKRVCDISLSITIELLKYHNNKINEEYIRQVDRSLL